MSQKDDNMPNELLNHILTINSGSSSIKFSLYNMERCEDKVLSGEVEGIGLRNGLFHAQDADGKSLIEQRLDTKNHRSALGVIFDWLKSNAYDRDLDAVGHRVVHGGVRYKEPQFVTVELIAELRKLSPFIPEHLPHELNAIDTVSHLHPAVKQVACFDTAFHRDMSRVAQLYALPSSLAAVLGGLDTLVFTGGIGENASAVRWRICEGLEFLGINLDPDRNSVNAPVISRNDSITIVRLIKTNEELMIARHTHKLLC